MRASPARSSWFLRLLHDVRGSSGLTVNLLLTTAGAAMVAVALPGLADSANTVSNTFQRQVSVLEQGSATPAGSGLSISVGPGGVGVSGTVGNVSGNVNIGKDGVTGSVSGTVGGNGGVIDVGSGSVSVPEANAGAETVLTGGGNGGTPIVGASTPLQNSSQVELQREKLQRLQRAALGL